MTIISNMRYLQEHNVNYQMITTFWGILSEVDHQAITQSITKVRLGTYLCGRSAGKGSGVIATWISFSSGLSYVICSQQLLHHLYDTVVFGRHLGTLQSDRFIFRTDWLFGVVRRERWISSGFNSSSGLWQSGDEGGITLYQSFDSPNHLTVACL